MWFSVAEFVGIFWDYENGPLRHRDWEDFTQGLENYIYANNVEN